MEIYTPFQAQFLDDLRYLAKHDQDMAFYKCHLMKKYSSFGPPIELTKQLRELTKEGIINKKLEKIVYKGKFSTKIYYALNKFYR